MMKCKKCSADTCCQHKTVYSFTDIHVFIQTARFFAFPLTGARGIEGWVGLWPLLICLC